MNAFLDIDRLVEQLKATCPLFCQRVFFSINGDADLAGHAMPLALVYEVDDHSTVNVETNGVNQKHYYSFAVKIAIRKNHTQSDRLGQQDAFALQALRQEVMAALIGFILAPENDPITHQKGTSSSTVDVYFWEYHFTTADNLIT